MSDPIPAPSTKRSRLSRILRRALAWSAVAFLGLQLFPVWPSFATSADRTLYFKLPIEGVRYHWVFQDPAAFLAGELTLRIINKDRDQTIVVFRDGKIQDGWEEIDDSRPDGGAYFGFASTTRFRTKADDSLIVTLTAPRDLLGRGPYSEGVLAAGTWQMSGTYSSIYGGRWNPIDLIGLHGDPPIAFMQCWAGVWPITITKHEGWRGGPQPETLGFLRKLTKARGTNRRVCGTHR